MPFAGDVGYALRALFRSPAYTLAAALSLGLGIGATTAIYSVVDAVLLRPLPYRNPDRLIVVYRDDAKTRTSGPFFSNADFYDLREATRNALSDIEGVFTYRAFVAREDGSAEQIIKAQATVGFLRMLGARIALGRGFTQADSRIEPTEPVTLLPAGHTAILSHEYWQRRCGGDPGVIGREMAGGGQRGPRIVGVLAPGFRLLLPGLAPADSVPDVWVANNVGYDSERRNLAGLRIVGLLLEGVGLKQAQHHADLAAAEMRKSVPGYDGLSIRLESWKPRLVAQVRPAILALMAGAVCLLLIACANVANLMLVRAWARERELAIRASLGGSFGDIAALVLTEAVLLAAFGTALGLAVATAGVRLLLRFAPAGLPRLDTVDVDARAAAIAVIAGVLGTALFGLLPALGAARPNPAQVLRGGIAAAPGPGRFLRASVAVAEVALSFILLTGSAIALRTWIQLQRVDPGYDPRGLLTFFLVREWNFDLPPQRSAALLGAIQQRLRALPGVESVSASAFFPLSSPSSVPVRWSTAPAERDNANARAADMQYCLPGYFETLRTRLVAGRTFTDEDNVAGRNVAVIDQDLAAKAFPGASAVGRRLYVPMPAAKWVEVIGVAAHQRRGALAEPGREQIYFTEGFAGFGIGRYWAVRTAGDPAQLAGAVRAAISSIDPQMVVTKMQPMQALADRDRAPARFSLLLLGSFAAIAAVLAAVGIYGVLATAVRQRTAEIGVRMALGAAPGRVFGLLLGSGLRIAGVGIAIGLLTARALAAAARAMLAGLGEPGLLLYAASAALFLAIALAASCLPARRAAALDPAVALRRE